jgi:replicative DNA helicase
MITTRKHYYDAVMEEIEKGRLGLHTGLDLGFPRLTDVLPNLQSHTYYLIGGETGSGKSSYATNTFVYNPIEDIIKHPEKGKLKVFIYSFEIRMISLIVKAICRKLYLQYGIITDVKYVLSKGKNRISGDIYDRVKALRDYFDILYDYVEVYDLPENPTGMNKYLRDYALTNLGKGIYEPFTDDATGQEQQRLVGFEPHQPNQYSVVLIDHISLVKKEKGYMTKANIDKLSEYMIGLRNTFGYSPVILQQLNRDLSSVGRAKLGRVEPQLSDFKDTGNTQQDSDYTMALFNPNRYELSEWRDYNTARMAERFRAFIMLKNREGMENFSIGMMFIGENGYFHELPTSKKIKEEDYAYLESLQKYHS